MSPQTEHLRAAPETIDQPVLELTAETDLKVPEISWPTLMLFFCATMVIAVSWWLALAASSPLWLCIPFLVIADFVLFTVMHEAAHGLIGRRASLLNRWVGEVSAILITARFTTFLQAHRHHHRFTHDPLRDPHDFAGRGPPWLRPLRWAFPEISYVNYLDSSNIPRSAVVVSRISLAAEIALVAMLLVNGYLWELLLLWLLPARLFSAMAFYLTDYLPHQRPFGRAGGKPLQQDVLVNAGRIGNRLLLGHSYHIVHHAFPSVPWYRLGWLEGRHREQWRRQGMREVPVFSLPTDNAGSTTVFSAKST